MADRPHIVETSTITKVKLPDGSKVINGFRVFEVLGTGSFAKVKLCEAESSAEKFAMKVYRKGVLRKQREYVKDQATGGMKIHTSLDKVYGEISIMRRVVHENCIRLYAVLDEAETFGKLRLVVEYAARGCSMDWDTERCTYRTKLSPNGLVPETVAAAYIHDALCGLGYLHGVLIAHRDIKPQNLFVTVDGRLKIGDFGVSIEMEPNFIIQGTEGTWCFWSPEMCRTPYNGHDGRLADVWALGVTLWAFFYGSVPFLSPDLGPLVDSIAEAKYSLPVDTSISEPGQTFLRHLLTPEFAARPLPAELSRDPWCRSPPKATAQMNA